MADLIENEIRDAASKLFDEAHDKEQPMDLLTAVDTQEALAILRKNAAFFANPSNSARFENSTFPYITFDREDSSLNVSEGRPDGVRTIKAKPYSVEISDESGQKGFSAKNSAEREYYSLPS